jgi:hypothetical protein
MPHRDRTLRIGTLLALAATCIALAGCGGSSGNAVALLRQTFCGKHTITSGNLNVALTITLSGSRTLKGPLSLSLSGPFQSLGRGKLPKSDLTISLSALGNSTSVGIVSTGTHGYVTLSGASYQLPQSSYHSLESSFSKFATPPGCSGKSGALGNLHIHPLHWLSNPQVVGTENVGGAQTTHVHAGIDVSALLSDLGSVLKKSPALGASGLSTSGLSAFASAIHDANFDLWTGSSDKTLRRLSVHLTVPVTGQFSTLLGGLRSAGIGLTMQYSDLNQPQTVNAPTNLQPYSQLHSKLAALVAAIRSQLSGVLSGALTSSTSGSSGAGTAGASGAGNYQAYSQCIQGAGGDVGKMQQCAPLLSSGK